MFLNNRRNEGNGSDSSRSGAAGWCKTSPGVYKHCHAGLDHFWECLPELNGGWSEDSSSDAQL